MFIKDFPLSWQYSFQDPSTEVMSQIIGLHDTIMFYLVLVLLLVGWMLSIIVYKYNKNKSIIAYRSFTDNSTLEIIWTLFPAVVLLLIAIPSLKLLYLTDEVLDIGVTIKVVGHQWYWSYELGDFVDNEENPIAFESYMISENDLPVGGKRLLEVDNRLIVPTKTNVRVLVTASDVLHSWAVPSLGVKIDAIPGRLNQTSFFIYREGIFFGQCSELCGFGHSLMPIVVEAVNLKNFLLDIKCRI